jgi:hypothetical protein
VFPVAAAAFLTYIMYRSVGRLGGWTGRDLVALYMMLAIGVVIMVYGRLSGRSHYFRLRRETYQPEVGLVVPARKTVSAAIREERGVPKSTAMPAQLRIRKPAVSTVVGLLLEAWSVFILRQQAAYQWGLQTCHLLPVLLIERTVEDDGS